MTPCLKNNGFGLCGLIYLGEICFHLCSSFYNTSLPTQNMHIFFSETDQKYNIYSHSHLTADEQLEY